MIPIPEVDINILLFTQVEVVDNETDNITKYSCKSMLVASTVVTWSYMQHCWFWICLWLLLKISGYAKIMQDILLKINNYSYFLFNYEYIVLELLFRRF